jgi:hypothetical protein
VTVDKPRLLADLEDFVSLHRPDGQLDADAGEPVPNGYRLLFACPCGVTFERWITHEDAAIDLALLARWNYCNPDAAEPARPSSSASRDSSRVRLSYD